MKSLWPPLLGSDIEAYHQASSADVLPTSESAFKAVQPTNSSLPPISTCLSDRETMSLRLYDTAAAELGRHHFCHQRLLQSLHADTVKNSSDSSLLTSVPSHLNYALPPVLPTWLHAHAYGPHALLSYHREKMSAISQQLTLPLAAKMAFVQQPSDGSGLLDLTRIGQQTQSGHYPFGKKLFGCSQCRYVTDRKNNLKRHVATMHQDCEKRLECCGVAFKNKASLRDHVIIFHSSGYMCRYCGRNFCRKALLKRHITVHSGQKDYVCEMCDYATSHKSNLERHKKVHDKQGGLDDASSDKQLDVGCHVVTSQTVAKPCTATRCDDAMDTVTRQQLTLSCRSDMSSIRVRSSVSRFDTVVDFSDSDDSDDVL
ncbi:hypothetical protein NP493_1161g00017 [Ridgeia piscesae]|uniref:C2H2-type domain-containing protein n=1 Tax=Ridgeia piscesae TaxID=27915 RepID=A0AAD9KEG2_RIDPI|nr:hypothetical protein NP493_1161g00017 [Ridgeia piscesae]